MSPERRERVEERAQGILLGMALQELRQARRLTQQELAEMLEGEVVIDQFGDGVD